MKRIRVPHAGPGARIARALVNGCEVACRIRRADERVAVDRGVEIENRGAVVALALVHEAAGVEGLRRLRVVADRL